MVEDVTEGAVGDGKVRLPGQVVLLPGLPQLGMVNLVRLVAQPGPKSFSAINDTFWNCDHFTDTLRVSSH